MLPTPEQLREAADHLDDLVKQYQLVSRNDPATEAPLREPQQADVVEMLGPCSEADLTSAARGYLMELTSAASLGRCTWGLIEDNAILLAGHLKRAADRADKEKKLATRKRAGVTVPIRTVSPKTAR